MRRKKQMIKPNGYDEAQVQGEIERPEVGGHHLIIKQVSERQNKNGGDMIVVSFDFAKNDKQPELFMKQFKADVRPDKKWPNKATQYINVLDNEGKTSRGYKTFCSCFENSNNVKINWVEDSAAWCAQFKNKIIGGAFGIVHSIYQGKEIAPVELRWFVTDSKVEETEAPKEKMLSDSDKASLSAGNNNTAPADGFMNIPDGVDEEVPFN
jgi:hypothetical protein